jgi:pyroglutamyl-peptidase
MARTMTGTILLSGFEPFQGEVVNPSWELAQALDGEVLAGHRVVAVQLPCVFGASLEVLNDAIARHDPALVLAIGQAGGRSQLSLERVAINIDDARIPDNAGAQPIDVPIVTGAAPAYFSRLPIKAMLAALQQAGIPAEISQSAGTYVCNHVFYGMMHALRDRPDIRCGFIHIPYLPEQAAHHPGAPSLPLAAGLEGVRVALRAALTIDSDTALTGGALH